jgi:hypothetical protein
MYLMTKINGDDVLMTVEQMDTMVAILRSSARTFNEYVGGAKGDDGGSYVKLLRPAVTADSWLECRAIPDDWVEAMRLKTKMHDENK